MAARGRWSTLRANLGVVLLGPPKNKGSSSVRKEDGKQAGEEVGGLLQENKAACIKYLPFSLQQVTKLTDKGLDLRYTYAWSYCIDPFLHLCAGSLLAYSLR